MNKAALLFLFLLINFVAYTQNNLLLLQKKGKTKQTFFPGRYIGLQTKHGNYAGGIITKIQYDSIYIRHFDIVTTYTGYGGILFDTSYRHTTVIHYKDIGALISPKSNAGRKKSGKLLMIAGGGVLALGAINGLYREEPPKDWYKPSGYITAGVLTGMGFLMNHTRKPRTTVGKKYQLKILTLETR